LATLEDRAFRLAVAADEALVVALTTAAYDRYTRAFGAPPLPVTESYGPRIAAGDVWLLQPAGQAVGLLVLERRADHVLIYSVAVWPEHQGKGYGLSLLAKAEREARAAGLREMRLYTNSRMKRNIALYTAYGYRETGRRPHPRCPDWMIVDMAKQLDDIQD
jgi:ribosomal protein S18 acetylase RimI-like enzyme